MTPRTDSDLLRDYVETGSNPAFAALVDRHISLVYSVALRVVVDVHLAEDVTQVTFATLAREARHLVGRAVLSSWLYRTASNQAAKLVRGEMRRRAREQEVFTMQTTFAEQDADWKRIAPLLDGALARLSEVDRTAILLRFFEKKTAKEIGAILKLSEEAAQKRGLRAVERLRELLARQGVAYSATSLACLIAAEGLVAAPMGLSSSVSATALAGSSVATEITLTTWKVIVMSKLKTAAVGTLIAVGVATPLLYQHQVLGDLRDANRKLSEEVASTGANPPLNKLQRAELVRLRSEIAPLRREAKLQRGLVSEKAGRDTVSPGAPLEFVPIDDWANVGADQPAAALQTLLWAGRQGETNLVSHLLRWRRDSAILPSDELDQMFAGGMIGGTTVFAGSLQGFRIVAQEAERDDEVRLDVELTDKNGVAKAVALRLVREADQWFPVMHVWLENSNSVRAALEVPRQLQAAR